MDVDMSETSHDVNIPNFLKKIEIFEIWKAHRNQRFRFHKSLNYYFLTFILFGHFSDFFSLTIREFSDIFTGHFFDIFTVESNFWHFYVYHNDNLIRTYLSWYKFILYLIFEKLIFWNCNFLLNQTVMLRALI